MDVTVDGKTLQGIDYSVEVDLDKEKLEAIGNTVKALVPVVKELLSMAKGIVVINTTNNAPIPPAGTGDYNPEDFEEGPVGCSAPMSTE